MMIMAMIMVIMVDMGEETFRRRGRDGDHIGRRLQREE